MSDFTVMEPPGPPVASRPHEMFLGVMRPDREDVSHLIAAVRGAVEKRAAGMDNATMAAFYSEFWPLELPDYCAYVRDFRQLSRDFRSHGVEMERYNAALGGLLSLGHRPQFTPDFEGWVAYLKALNPVLEDKMARLSRASALPEAGRREHTLIVAPVNWGKSELLKTLAYHYAEHAGLAAVVVLDPGGDMAKQIAKWPELVRDDRVILIEPGLQQGKTVSLNPFDGAGLDEDERSIVAAFWAQQFGALTSDLTPPMERLARHSVNVLLAFPGGTTFRDLLLLLGAPKGKDSKNPRQRALVDFARHYKNSRIAEFFKDDFEAPFFEPTRQALRGRIDWILSLPYAEAMFCGPANFSLEKEIEKPQVHRREPRQAGGAAIGKVFVAMLGAIARKRNTLPPEQRTPTHVFIDEVSTMVSADLLQNLKELRKFGLYQTLAQQVEGDSFSKEYRQILTRLTACKFVGSPSGDVGNLLHNTDSLPPLDHRQFYVQWPGAREVACLQVRADLADNRHAVSDDEWREYESRMIAAHYVDAGEDHGTAPTEYRAEAGILMTPAETRKKRSFDHEAEAAAEAPPPEAPRADSRAVQIPKPTAGRRKPPRRQ